ncbi:MAG: hypothetical protein EOR96_31950 [Mesorhizobium sp.]|nr:MAG: hypothetical protein EOR96_31950 [Mesorhizobium sp.]
MVDTVAINNKFALDMKMGPVFQTTVIPLMGGYEDRNQDWQVALWRYDVELKNRPLSEIRSFMAHVLGRRGSMHIFPLRDPLDSTLTDENIGTGDGVTTEFQITKTYADADRPYRRPLAIVSSLVVKVAGVTKVEGSNYAQGDGWIAFANAPTVGQAITVSCDFLIPVRYESDVNPITLPIGPGTSNAFASAGPFTLMERPVAKPTLVAPPATLAISGTPVLTAGKDVAYAGFTVSGIAGHPPYTYSVHSGSLPAGITLDSSTGVVSGTATTIGTSSGIVIRVTDNVGATADLASFSINVTVVDPSFSSVVLLCGFDGTDGATSATDDSNLAHALTFVGNAQIDTFTSKFGGSSLLLDGNGDRVTAADSAGWSFGTGEFTIEGFFRFSAHDGTVGLVTQWFTSVPGWAFFFDGGQLFFRGADAVSSTRDSGKHTFSPTLNQWYHLAVDRTSAGAIRIYVDGVMVAGATGYTWNLWNAAHPLWIGGINGFAAYDMAGWVDELRITKGVARYASDSGFAVPTAAYPRI